MSEIKNLKPECIWRNFHALTQVPRPSGHLEKVQQFLLDFAKQAGVEAFKDEADNIVMRKPATPGMENRKTRLLQAHMDMVPQKSPESTHDFENYPIEAYVDGEWVRAKGTTLGADDGIGVAMQMAILKSSDIKHGPIECLFTRDEETGLTGAMGLQPGFMTGDFLINLDSEDEGQMFVSCAGGVRTTARFKFEEESVPEGYFFFKVGVKGLTGGHSGDDINKKRANANKLLVRYLMAELEKTDLRLVDIQSGGLHNAIPREGYAVCAVPFAEKEQMRIDLNVLAAQAAEEYSVTEKEMEFYLESQPAAAKAIDRKTAQAMLLSLQAVHNGVFAMSQDLDWLVETSSNLASIHKLDGIVEVTTSQRSSVGSACEYMAEVIRAAFRLGGAEVETNEGYPGWKMNPNSVIVKIAEESYKRLFGKEPKILAIHAGLECGLFSEKYPHLDMVSFGPTLRGVHSPDERLLIPTVQMVWDHLLDILVNIPNK